MGRRRCWSAIYVWLSGASTAFCQSKAKNCLCFENSARRSPCAALPIWEAKDRFQDATVWKNSRSSDALDIGPHRLGFLLDPLHPVLHKIADRNDSGELAAVEDRKMPDPALRHRRQCGQDRGR